MQHTHIVFFLSALFLVAVFGPQVTQPSQTHTGQGLQVFKPSQNHHFL